MADKVWTKSQARNNKAFQSRLDKITGYLAKGHWHASYGSWSESEDDVITNNVFSQEYLASRRLTFLRLPGGGLKAEEIRLDDVTGGVEKETYLVSIQPFQRTFYMVSLDDNDVVLGSIPRGTNTISFSKLETSETGDGVGIGGFQFTNVFG